MPFFREKAAVIETLFFCVPGFALLFLSSPASAQSGLYQMNSNGFKIFFTKPLERTARDCAAILPRIEGELEKTFGWRFLEKPTVLLVGDRAQISHLSRHPLVAGFAVPQKNAVVIDCSRVRTPLDLKNILKHEFCHLLLHQNIQNVFIPRWLDEGVAQWTSDGMTDIMWDQKRALLPKAVVSNAVIPLSRLKNAFPAKPNQMILAYEESKSFVDYIIRDYGKPGLIEWLHLMKSGMDLQEAAGQAWNTPFDDGVCKWYDSLNPGMTWAAQLSYYIYEILFAFGGLIVVFGFIRIWRKKRAYMREME